jgi:hypothetical protein
MAAFDKAGDLWVTNSRVKTELRYYELMVNGKNSTDKILSASEDNSFHEW